MMDAPDYMRRLGTSPEAMLGAARACRANAYAPYSDFQVGAAILTDDGRIYTGCNVENTSFGLTICAERAAMCAAVAGGSRRPLAVAVVGSDDHCLPCGMCRQFLAEFNDSVEFFLDDGGEVARYSLDDLMPHRFRLNG